jgi:DegV family protein with EDD domain
MSGVAIVTDTISCLPPEILKEYGIIVVPTMLIINGKSYRDNIDMNNEEFWKQFDGMQSFSTNAALPGDFMSAFQEAGQTTQDIICVLVSKALSATHQSALQACELLKEDNSPLHIDVIDSRTATGAEGFIALEGPEQRAGKSKVRSHSNNAGYDNPSKVDYIYGDYQISYQNR